MTDDRRQIPEDGDIRIWIGLVFAPQPATCNSQRATVTRTQLPGTSNQHPVT